MERSAGATDRDAAWAAFERGDWGEARTLFERVLEEDDDPDALDGLGQVRWFLCEIDEGIALRERAYAAFRASGDDCRAGDIALWVAIEYASSLGNSAAASGWFRRGERLLEGLPLCPPQVDLGPARPPGGFTARRPAPLRARSRDRP